MGRRHAGLPFDEALAVTGMATLLPPNERSSAEVQTAVDWARATLERLGAMPLLGRLGYTAEALQPPNIESMTGTHAVDAAVGPLA